MMRARVSGRFGWQRSLAHLVTWCALGLAACGDSGTKSATGGFQLDPIGNQTVDPNRSLVLRLTASGAEGRHVVYSSTALPENAELIPSTGLFAFTPDASQAGTTWTITFTASEHGHQDSERVLVSVGRDVQPVNGSPELSPIGNHTVRAGSTLTLQHHAADPESEPVTFSVHPSLPPNASYDNETGLFTFTPSVDQVGTYAFSFIATDGFTVDHETVHLVVLDETSPSPCAVTTPTGCVPLSASTPTPSSSPAASASPSPPADLVVENQCYTVASGSYTYRHVNVAKGGQLIFIDDGGTIDFRASSVLVEQDGSLQAGSLDCPFGSAGGKLEIGLWGTDPTKLGTDTNPTPGGIACVGRPTPGECFDPNLTARPHYCLQPTPPATPSGTWSPSDPCNVTVPAGDQSTYGNAFFEGYNALNYDYSSNDIPNYFGYKVFAVSYGGSVQLFGRKGVAKEDLVPQGQTTCDTPANQYDVDEWAKLSGQSWARLDQTVAAGDTTLTLDRAVDWSEGDRLVIGTTDWYPGHSEVAEVHFASTTDGKTTLTLSGPLSYAHNGQTYQVPPTVSANAGNPNTELDLRAPVGLLSRSIAIYSLGDTAADPFPNPQSADWDNCSFASNSGQPPAHPECYFGGHLIVRQGVDTFQVQGVELRQLGQGGRMGHYPMHLHMLKSTDYTDVYVKDCSIWDSMDRFVVLHATHGATVARNVGFMSMGHGFYLEDGSEIENLLCQNLAVSVRGSMNEFFDAQPADSPLSRFVPPILDGSNQALKEGDVFGGDTILPVAFWTMNTWNELVGNATAGVYGYGSCYWFLGSGVSGPSMQMTWSKGTDSPADYAHFNIAGETQAPVKRFRGNSCSSAAYGLLTTLEVQPTGNTKTAIGFTPATNPYNTSAAGQFDRPNVTGNFLPVKYGANPNCANSYPQESQFDGTNEDYCVTTVIDRLSTSFNRAGADFGSVWLRPLWFVFMNSAITDQLGGGLGFITGGSWTQTPPGYFSITKNSVFVGATQPDNPDAAPLGPAVCPSPTPSASCATACAGPACSLYAEGIGMFTGSLNPKRMMTIYDGPFYSDGSVFTETSPIVCDTTGPAPFDDPNSCQIYSSTTQPQYQPPSPPPSPQMNVVNAAIGWKQPNGFYYPPAFAFRKSAFDANTFRHNVIDQYETYLQGSLASPTGQPAQFAPLGENYAGITPIDFSTILNDMDGTLTGWTPRGGTRTSSLSKNHFFNAPSQDAECKSFGVQTSPYEFVSSVIAPAGGEVGSGFYVDPGVWGVAETNVVPIYRQLLLPDDECKGDQSVCCAKGQPDCPAGTVGCTRGSFMMGGQGGQAPYLTSNFGVYYIDTNPQELTPSCFETGTTPSSCTSPTRTPGSVCEYGFKANRPYVLYNLFANENTKVTYQLYVGDDFKKASGGQWVMVQPHVYNPGTEYGGNAIAITPITDPEVLKNLNAGVTVTSNGLLQAVFDHSAIKDAYLFSSQPQYNVCLPRDICQIDTSTNPPSSCTIQARASFLDGNATDYNDYKKDVGDICSYWATATAGRMSLPNTVGDDAGDPIFADCPAGGCLGYMFTLPSGFTPKPYATVGASRTGCFDAATWDIPMQGVDPDCPTPATPNPAAFCASGGTPTPTPSGATSTPTATASATSTPTGTHATATSTATAASTPTWTSTSTPTGGIASTPTGTVTPTPAGTVTPTPTGTTPTPTSTPGALVWVLNGTPADNLTVPADGQTYGTGVLNIQDSGNRFCTSAGKYPVVKVNGATMGAFEPPTSSGTVGIANIPGGTAGMTYDVTILTFAECNDPQITLTMPDAITYTAGAP